MMSSFGILGLRPIGFLNEEQRSTWGNNNLETLLDQYGKPKTRANSTAQPVVDPVVTRSEWSVLKNLVYSQGYPRDSMANLWKIINTHHHDEFPNLLKLAALALTSPIHTAECERGFSVQNHIKTTFRNRLSDHKMDEFCVVSVTGCPVNEFNGMQAMKIWRNKKNRKIFNTT